MRIEKGIIILIKSMTGYGRAVETVNGREFTVELRSVNNRYLDLNFRLPRAWTAMEERIKAALSAMGVSRGKVDFSVTLTDTRAQNGAALTEPDLEAARNYLKAAAALLGKAYPKFSGRMVKDTDEISVDKTFVADQSVTSLCLAVRRIISYREEHPAPDKVTFTPMIAKPIVPVEAKIVGILRHFETKERVSMTSLIEDAVSLPDMIAVFLGILELVKLRRIMLVEKDDTIGSVYGIDTEFIVGDAPVSEETSSEFSSDFDSDTQSVSQEVNNHAE